MGEIQKVIELEITPIPPDTISSTREELAPTIEDALRKAGHDNLLKQAQIEIRVEKTFPTSIVVVAIVNLFSKMAFEVFKQIILPELKRHYEIKYKSREVGKDEK
jgi:hypothetical protein